MDRGALNLAWARALVRGLVRVGLREVCVAPGSRSTPLVLALAESDAVRRFVHLDERSAAFFALGVGKRTGRPAAVVTTSGTAVANLHPAVLEASRSGAPLLLLTADRPPRLRGTVANQTVDQAGIFGGAVRLYHDAGVPEEGDDASRYLDALAARAWSAAVGRPAGPVHLNLPFDKPLQPSPGGAAEGGEVDAAEAAPAAGAAAAGAAGPTSSPRPEATRAAADPRTIARLAGRLSGSARGLVVAGPDPDPERLGPAARELARAAGWPLLADPLSGARYGEGAGDAALGAYDLFLRSGAVRERLRPELVLRFGGRPTSRVLDDYLSEVRLTEGRPSAGRHVEIVAVSDLPPWPDHRGVAAEVVRADPASLCRELADRLAGTGAGAPGRWPEAWRAAEGAASEAAREAVGRTFLEGTVLEAVVRSAPDGATLFVGSSMPVRDLDAFGFPRDGGLRIVGNRGASGIDGSVSTALGAAAAAAEDGPAIAVIGDLALLHDVNGLRAASAHGIPLVVVVVQNDGGGIFHLLPIREHEPHFEPYFATPHGLDLRHAAELYEVPFRRLDVPPERLGEALERELEEAVAAAGPRVIEVPSDREANRARREEAVRSAAAAAEEALAG